MKPEGRAGKPVLLTEAFLGGQLSAPSDVAWIVLETLAGFGGPSIDSSMNYYALIESDRWQELRHHIHKRDGGQCVICGDSHNLDTHHWTYRWGYFNPATVSLVCRRCHLVWQGRNPDHLPDGHFLKEDLLRVAGLARYLGRGKMSSVSPSGR